MKKEKILNIVNYCIIAICLVVAIILGIVMKMSNIFYMTTCVMTICVSIVSLIILLIKEITILSYDSKKLEPVLYAVIIVSSSLCYYLAKFVDGYDKFGWLYWLGFLVMLFSSIVVFCIIFKGEKNEKLNNDNKPKFLVNK
ncbi:MAG: hypothetical protein E7176_01055 [Erysipelotrichaceae bacterium]|nr:hypothetical protein [Erysipelotrichaceae bacterium]